MILESDGFGDLLERAEFLKRISDQDAQITNRVRGLKDQAHDQAVQLAGLEQQEQVVAERILHERDQVAAVENQLVGARDQLASVRAGKRGALAQVRESRVSLEGDLAALEKEQARVQAALQGAGQTFDGPVRQGSGALNWPVSGPVVSPFGMRWGRLHAGIDIAVPSGTAIHAAGAGRVVLMGWVGGYGNYTCIQHTREHVHVLRAPGELRHLERSVREPGPGDRLQRLHRPLLRPAPPLRGPDQRGARRSDGLPLAPPAKPAEPLHAAVAVPVARCGHEQVPAPSADPHVLGERPRSAARQHVEAVAAVARDAEPVPHVAGELVAGLRAVGDRLTRTRTRFPWRRTCARARGASTS